MLALLPADVLLIGEQHDSADHHRIERATVEALAERGVLAALALEMVERGRSTRGLSRDADEAAVRHALAWNDAAWPWAHYGPAVMTAVRHGVPVIGANLPRSDMKDAMADNRLDLLLGAVALAQQQQAVRAGHCDLLPERQIAPMTRIQIARDQAMARAVEGVIEPGRTVLLVAGGGHVRRDLGVPLHLRPEIRSKVVIALVQSSSSASDSIAKEDALPASSADLWVVTPALAPKDHCATLR